MLSRKQTWRRQSSIFRQHEELYNCHNEKPNRSLSDSALSDNLSRISSQGRLWATTGDLTNPPTITALVHRGKKSKGNVKFKNNVRVVLVPTREDYKSSGVDCLIWWEEADYISFKTSALSELRDAMKKYSLTDAKAAIKLLYHNLPGNISDDVSEQVETSKDFSDDVNENSKEKVESSKEKVEAATEVDGNAICG